jgi:scyllo-inositol 2-dehydrogenase (NADP+)
VTIHLGVIGPGLIWQKSHRPALERLSGRIQVSAICARQQSALDFAGVPDARQYTRIEDLLHDPDLDAVMVLTPIRLNAPTAIAALRAGKHVFLEKPAGTCIDECRALLAAEAASGKHVYVLEQAVYGSSLLSMKRVIDEKRLGDLVLYDRFSHGILDSETHDAGGYGKTAWRQQADFPLGALFDGGIHTIAELTRLFGIPERVFASGKKWRSGFGEYDEVLMHFTYASGLRGIFSHSAALPGVHGDFTIRGTAGTLRPGSRSLQVVDLDSKTEELPMDDGTRAGMWEQILTAYERNVAAPYSCADAAQDVAILDAVAQGLRSGREERIVPLN